MVTIKTTAGGKLNMDNMTFYAIPDLNGHTTTSKLYGAYSLAGFDTEFRGSGFRYKDGLPTDGKISSITFYQYGEKAYTVTGFSGSMKTAGEAIKSGPTDDDRLWFIKLQSGNDVITGGKQDDRLYGYDGNDTIKGGSGDDFIYGGAGKDVMSGGAGRDTFHYHSHLDAKTDKITDFRYGDVIDLRSVDADLTKKGDQAFHFVDKLSGDAGELVSRAGKVFGDVNGDGKVDFQILTPGAHLVVSDIWL